MSGWIFPVTKLQCVMIESWVVSKWDLTAFTIPEISVHFVLFIFSIYILLTFLCFIEDVLLFSYQLVNLKTLPSLCPCQSGGAGGSQHAAVLQAVRSGKSGPYTGDMALLFCC